MRKLLFVVLILSGFQNGFAKNLVTCVADSKKPILGISTDVKENSDYAEEIPFAGFELRNLVFSDCTRQVPNWILSRCGKTQYECIQNTKNVNEFSPDGMDYVDMKNYLALIMKKKLVTDAYDSFKNKFGFLHCDAISNDGKFGALGSVGVSISYLKPSELFVPITSVSWASNRQDIGAEALVQCRNKISEWKIVQCGQTDFCASRPGHNDAPLIDSYKMVTEIIAYTIKKELQSIKTN